MLRVALEHVLLKARGPGELIVLSSRQLREMTAVPAREVELLIMNVHPDAAQALATLERALALLAPRAVLALYETENAALGAAFAERGVRGYVPQSLNAEALTAAVSLVLAGGECYPRRDATPVLPLAPRPPGGYLTRRQEQILSLLVRGYSMREIARQIGISAATVKSHVRALYWKLNVRSQAEAAFIARRRGLVGPADTEQDD
ncbi:response regulator transcription factor [Pigmentiphaga soli]|uniref:Response regulator transcription factor n=1 Tax=Pigmentiphaga soli TaxID=1007095 RepID=A0ABP8GVG3_9BURK